MPPSNLFSRQQIAELTKIDDSTLNYWMREGVLRPAAGGQGRGSHRRFAYHQVTLAALLNELRGFGIGFGAIARLAARFHSALEWMAERGITLENKGRIFTAYLLQKEIVRNGYYSWRVTTARDEALLQGIPRIVEDHGWVYVHLNWDQAVRLWFADRPEDNPEFAITESELALVHSWDTADALQSFSANHNYFSLITSINLREPDDNFTTSADYFYRDENGDLAMTPDESEAQRSVAYIGVDVGLLTCRLWAPLLSSKRGTLRERFEELPRRKVG
jgi:hypothetical protein